MIYFAQADVSGQIKIGYHGGIDANDRLRELQTGCPTRLTLLGTIPGGPETEADLHRQFAFAHEHGEWFRPVPDLLAYIGTQQNGHVVNGVRAEVRFVQVKILTVNSKSFTRKFYDQLLECCIIDWPGSNPEEGFAVLGDPWGWVRDPLRRRGAFGTEQVLLWNWEGTLCKWRIP